MFKKLLPLVLAGLAGFGFARPALAQDLTTEFSQVYRQFTLPGFAGNHPDVALAAIGAVLNQLQGNWIRADILSGDSGIVMADLIAEACGRQYDRLVLVPPFGFELQRVRQDGEVALHVRFDYQGLNIFQRSYSETEWLTYLGLEEVSPPPVGAYYGQSRGEVFLFWPSPNVMFFQQSRGGAEFYLRCPDAP